MQNLGDTILGLGCRRGGDVGISGRLRAPDRIGAFSGGGFGIADCIGGLSRVDIVGRKIDHTALRRLLGRHVHRLFGVGDQFFLDRFGRLCATLGHCVIDLIVLVRHDGAARIFRPDLDRCVVRLDDDWRISAAGATERQRESAETAGERHGADDCGDQQAAAPRPRGILLSQAGNRHGLIQFGVVVEFVQSKVVGLRGRPAVGQVGPIEAAGGIGIRHTDRRLCGSRRISPRFNAFGLIA
ncbi:hypothetical protein [Mesorhizobium sp.]|uniref:hypothetical protein n=1 Tax=Mesorhizobium sp. TaxID=1871066 RepID=UPI003434B624